MICTGGGRGGRRGLSNPYSHQDSLHNQAWRHPSPLEGGKANSTPPYPPGASHLWVGDNKGTQGAVADGSGHGQDTHHSRPVPVEDHSAGLADPLLRGGRDGGDEDIGGNEVTEGGGEDRE